MTIGLLFIQFLLARAVVDGGVRHQILEAARNFYIKYFCGSQKSDFFSHY
jgi:hypothetical protein